MSPLLVYTANAFELCFRLTSGLALLALLYTAWMEGPTDWPAIRWLGVAVVWGELAAELSASLAVPGARAMYARVGVAYPAGWLLAVAAAIYLAREAPDDDGTPDEAEHIEDDD